MSIEDEIITIGKPIDHKAVYILNKHSNKVAPGAIGELYISGAGVSPGYINRPELNAEKFIPDKFSKIAGQKMYKTGDLVKLYKTGDIQFMGRIDNQVKIRGYRIETEEIEYQLKEHVGIKDALVLVQQDSVDNSRLIAYLTLKNPLEEIPESDLILDLKNRLKNSLPEYMVPSDYLFLQRIPLLPSGKVDRKALPDFNVNNNTSTYEAPTTELEKVLTEIWINHIGIKDIGINDNFFDLGEPR